MLRPHSAEKDEASSGGRQCETWSGGRKRHGRLTEHERHTRKRLYDEDRHDRFKRTRYEEARDGDRSHLPAWTDSASRISGRERSAHMQDVTAGMSDQWLVSDIMIHLNGRSRSRQDLKSWESRYYEKMDNLLFHVEETVEGHEDGCPLESVHFNIGLKPEQAFTGANRQGFASQSWK